MSYRSVMGLGAVLLLVVAATTIDTQSIVWNPVWPVRSGIGGVGVLLAFAALLVGEGFPMNRAFKWGLGFLVGVLVANIVWLFALESPSARFFTPGWWQLWAAAYGVSLIAIAFGVVRLPSSKASATEDPNTRAGTGGPA